MRFFSFIRGLAPSPLSALLAAVSGGALVFAFPDFEIYWLAAVALVPLFYAIGREADSFRRSFTTGWIFGTVFFFGTCWWLTFAPITYAGLPWPPVYFLMFCAAAGAGVFPAVFSGLLGVALRRFGTSGMTAAPFLWVLSEFLRMWISGNNWNALGYALAFSDARILQYASIGGVYAVSFCLVAINTVPFFVLMSDRKAPLRLRNDDRSLDPRGILVVAYFTLLLIGIVTLFLISGRDRTPLAADQPGTAYVVAVQPNVPMDGLTIEKYEELLRRHVELAESMLKQRREDRPTLVVFPESPMLFQYGEDEKLREFLRLFAERNRTAVLFNSAERSSDGRQLLNSAVMVNDSGAKIGQYDKIFLLPFGEYIPFPEPVASWMPAFVGNFKKGTEYDLLPVGDAKAGVMICFESHFGGLSNEYVRNGANMLIEMTNDGYLGKTPVLRQHLANAVFRAIETRRPVLRVTNVGVTAYIDPEGNLHDTAESYVEEARLWPAHRLLSGITVYTRIGDSFAIGCSLAALLFVLAAVVPKRRK